jgi:hypothetical protein
MRKYYLADSFLRLIKRLGLRDWKNKIIQSDKGFERPALSERFRKDLQFIFKKDINKLEHLIERDLSFWK